MLTPIATQRLHLLQQPRRALESDQHRATKALAGPELILYRAVGRASADSQNGDGPDENSNGSQSDLKPAKANTEDDFHERGASHAALES